MTGLEIAVIGMSCRFPGAPNIESFWRLLEEGREAISFFSDEELLASGVPRAHIEDPLYVRARGVLENIDMFDAEFFGFTRWEAELTDPQQRIFHECAWEALEDAGYDPGRYAKPIGVYAGANTSRYLAYLQEAGYGHLALSSHAVLGNTSDFLATRVAYKLNLNGPAIGVQTACSTSLVALHVACQGLLSGECDMALTGGAAIVVPQKVGYLYQEDGIESRDGHCRAFDAASTGAVGGNGVGVVLLKRLADAIEDRDRIYAVIKSSAVNNDGARKIGFTAPSIDGQAEAIRDAQMRAEVEPGSISYVEAHGTGTPIGGPIELAALTQAFRSGTSKTQYCCVGSVKTNIGHLDAAAGIAGFIKTVLAIHNGVIPATLHFKTPNPRIDLTHSPFYVTSSPVAFEPAENGQPRRAAVSSLGIGGTNAHVVLEGHPLPVESPAGKGAPILTLAAKTPDSLRRMRTDLARFLAARADINLFDVAYTLHVGRRRFEHRFAAVCKTAPEAINHLESAEERFPCQQRDMKLAFLFPGQGVQCMNAGRELYEEFQTFREQVDECSRFLEPSLGLNLRALLYPSPENAPDAERRLLETAVAQPAIFVIEYALARLWIEWGLRPAVMVGHSLGEYVAACLAGVLCLEDALRVVAFRGRLMQEAGPGAMLAVGLPAKAVSPLLTGGLSLAAVNSLSLCVVAGPPEDVDALERSLNQQRIFNRRLRTKFAFHSSSMDVVLPRFVRFMKNIRLKPPTEPYLSGLTGECATEAQATGAEYWGEQMRRTVQFAKGIASAREMGCHTFLEVGPGAALAGVVSADLSDSDAAEALSSLPASAGGSDLEAVQRAVARLWARGAPIDWDEYHRGDSRRRVGLPTYHFDRHRVWLDPRTPGREASRSENCIPAAADSPRSEIAAARVERDGEHPTQGAIGIIERQISIMRQQLQCWRDGGVDGKTS